MENTNILENESSAPAKRPTFITVLCILTWVGCAIGLYSSLTGLFGPSPKENLAKMMQRSEGMSGGAKEYMDNTIASMTEFIEPLERWARPIGAIGLIGVVLCLIGSLQMWKLKKSGFYIYAVGELVPLIISMILLGGVMFSMHGTMGTIMKVSNVAGIILAFGFVFMYYSNLKHMK